MQRWSAFGIILLTDIWLWTPWFTLLLLAGLQSLPKEPFEAAAIDGTTTWRVFHFLTLPMLRPVIVVCVVIRAIDAFRTFDIVWTLTGGGPGRSTELFSLYAYVHAFLNLDLGRGSAAAIIGGLIILVIGMALYRLVDRIAKADPMAMVRRPEFLPMAAADRPQDAVCAGACFHLLRVRLSGAVADPDFAASGIGRLLRPSRH